MGRRVHAVVRRRGMILLGRLATTRLDVCDFS